MLYCRISLWPVKMPIGYALCLNWGPQKKVIETPVRPDRNHESRV